MSIEYIVQQVILTVLQGTSRLVEMGLRADRVLCPYHEDPSVRIAIHSMVRMVACSARQEGDPVTEDRFISVDERGSRRRIALPANHIISPCYPSNRAFECNHADLCPYVIGHSIYLWVGIKRDAVHCDEIGGVGCNFKHSLGSEDATEASQNARAFRTREQVFECLERLYGEQSWVRMGPIVAMDTIRFFYNHVIRRLLAEGKVGRASIPARNLSTKRVEYIELYKSDDTIFWKIDSEEEEESHEEETEPIDDDTDRFPSLPTTGGTVANETAVRDERFPPLTFDMSKLQERASSKPLYTSVDDDM